MDRAFSIQVFIWRQQRVLAFRNTGYYPIFGLKFNPYDDTQFITCGYQHMTEWRIVGTQLTVMKFVAVSAPAEEKVDFASMTLEEQNKRALQVEKKNILISMDFLSYRMGHSIQSDVLFGNNLGDISTYCASKYFVLNE